MSYDKMDSVEAIPSQMDSWTLGIICKVELKHVTFSNHFMTPSHAETTLAALSSNCSILTDSVAFCLCYFICGVIIIVSLMGMLRGSPWILCPVRCSAVVRGASMVCSLSQLWPVSPGFVGLMAGHLPSASCLKMEDRDKSSQGQSQGGKSQTSSRKQGSGQITGV